jgi:ankyrin repeat protein
VCWRLLAAGCPVDTANHAGDTPLLLACSQGHVAVARILLDAGARVDVACGPTRTTPLHRAAAHGHVDVVRALLGAAPGAVGLLDAGEWTPLMRAAAGDHAHVCRLLLAHGADTRARNQHGHTAAEVAGKALEAEGRGGQGRARA